MIWYDRLVERINAAYRAFVLGTAVVEPFDRVFGKPSEIFTPPGLSSYLLSSNGVYACTDIRATLLASLPLRLFKGDDPEGLELVTSGSLHDLLKKVNPFWTFNRLIKQTELSLGIWGKAFWFLERGESGLQEPREIWWGRSDRVRVVTHQSDYVIGFIYDSNGLGTSDLFFRASEVFWLRYPNIVDEFEGLSPLWPARLAADVATASMQSNHNLFINGLMSGGFIFPKEHTVMTVEQASDLEEMISRRMKGVDKAHRWAVMLQEFNATPMGVTPKDAEFLGGLQWSLEEICRAYRIPLDLVGGQRTFENYGEAKKAAWTDAVLPEGDMIASEMKEQIFPMFPGQADLAKFDSSKVEVLQEDEKRKWEIAQGELREGTLLINEYRMSVGRDPVSWGDVWWAPVNVLPAGSAPVVATEPQQTLSTAPRLLMQNRLIELGSIEHDKLWRQLDDQVESHFQRFKTFVGDLFRRQQKSVKDRLDSLPDAQVARNPFSKARWTRIFREESRPLIEDIVEDSGVNAMEDLPTEETFDPNRGEVQRFIEGRSQRFATEVNDTTWEQLRTSLSEGIGEGESTEQLANRVDEVMGNRIRSSADTIARTEVQGAANGGNIAAWRQSGVVDKKAWLSSRDALVRDTHEDAHSRYQREPIPLDEEFEVGSGRGPAPGNIGVAEEDINCRCRMVPIVETEERNYDELLESLAARVSQ